MHTIDAAADLTFDASDPRFYSEGNRPAFLRIHAGPPVYRVEAEFSQPFWNVCTHELIRDVGKRAELFATTSGVHLTNAAFSTEETLEVPAELAKVMMAVNVLPLSEHRRLRGPMNPHFRHDVVARLSGSIRETVQMVLDEVTPGEEVDFVETFASRIPPRVIAMVLGIDPAGERDYFRWADAIRSSCEPGATPDFASIGEMIGFFAAEIEARRADPRDDLITHMLSMAFEDAEIIMWCWILLAAGTETTGGTMATGLDLLLQHPDQMARICEDRTLVRPAVNEVLRVITPGRYIRRTATADGQIGEIEVAAGESVVMNFTVANYDPSLFEDPLRFDIDRDLNEALAFSYGPHRCIGMSVARMETIIAFEELLGRFPNIEARGRVVVAPTLATAVATGLRVVYRA
jgi:cytochrome P450